MSSVTARPIPAYPEPGRSLPFEVDFETYMAMPVTNRHVEVVDGVVQVMPAATPHHQKVIANLQFEIEVVSRRDGTGFVLPAPLDIVIQTRPKLRVRQPDLSFFSLAPGGVHKGDPLDAIRAGALRPDLVIEVLSPGQNETTLADKLADYAGLEIDEVWFADQEAKSIRVLTRDGSGYGLAGDFHVGDCLISAVLPGIELDVASVFR